MNKNIKFLAIVMTITLLGWSCGKEATTTADAGLSPKIGTINNPFTATLNSLIVPLFL